MALGSARAADFFLPSYYCSQRGSAIRSQRLHFPNPTFDTHTMASALEAYVRAKVPQDCLAQALAQGYHLEIHGLYPDHALSCLSAQGFSLDQFIAFKTPFGDKKYNTVRPVFAQGYNPGGQKVVVAAVTPGWDYVQHYAGLLRYSMNRAGFCFRENATVYHYPERQERLTQWTALASVVAGATVVVLGYVQEIQDCLRDQLSIFPTDTRGNAFYECVFYKISPRCRLAFLGVYYSFWGCISAKIATTLCALGVQDIIYSAKLGALGGPEELYSTVFSPTQFLTLHYTRVIVHTQDVFNPIARMFPGHQTGLHVSVPTVLEEDLCLRDQLDAWGAASIDNEISQMAAAISVFNSKKGTRVRFAPLHFATDYLRRSGDPPESTAVGLHNHRAPRQRTRKHRIIQVCADMLWKYINHKATFTAG